MKDTTQAAAKIGYVLDRDGRQFSYSSCSALQSIAAEKDPMFKNGLGMLFLSGPEYMDPGMLAAAILERPQDTLVAVYDEDRDMMGICAQDERSARRTAGTLEAAAGTGRTSWEVLHATIDWEVS